MACPSSRESRRERAFVVSRAKVARVRSVVDRPRVQDSLLSLSLSLSLVFTARTASEQFESGVTGNQEGRRPAKDNVKERGAEGHA